MIKTVVLFDTLFTQGFTDEEIKAMVAHEIGHWYHRHDYKILAMDSANIAVLVSAFALCINNKSLLASFGFCELSNFVSLLIFTKLSEPISFITRLAVSAVIRGFERDADLFAAKNHKEAVKTSLIRIF